MEFIKGRFWGVGGYESGGWKLNSGGGKLGGGGGKLKEGGVRLVVMELWFDDEKGCKFLKFIVVVEIEGVIGLVVMVVDMVMEWDVVEEEDCGVGFVMLGGYDWW